MKRKLILILIVLVILVVESISCVTQADKEDPVLKRIVEEDLWQPIPTSVGYSSADLQLIILRRQEVINQKLDKLLTDKK